MDPVRHMDLALLLASATWATACDVPTPAMTAVRVEQRQCDPASDEAQLRRLLDGVTILEVEPRYSLVHTMSNNAEERIFGATIRMRPPEGISAEQMTRMLQCHSARALLGHIDPAPISNDPFWLPNAWVSIDVKPEEGNYAVTTETDRSADNIRLAALAAAFARTRGASASGPSLE
jgi:hypothetical protein